MTDEDAKIDVQLTFQQREEIIYLVCDAAYVAMNAYARGLSMAKGSCAAIELADKRLPQGRSVS